MRKRVFTPDKKDVVQRGPLLLATLIPSFLTHWLE
jgi:hypothetical protein